MILKSFGPSRRETEKISARSSGPLHENVHILIPFPPLFKFLGKIKHLIILSRTATFSCLIAPLDSIIQVASKTAKINVGVYICVCIYTYIYTYIYMHI